MSALTITAPGVDRLAQTIGQAADDLVDLASVNADAGALVIGYARIPRRTGALSNTVRTEPTAVGVTITAGGNGVDYAIPVHALNPFLTDALTAHEADVVDLYVGQVTDILDQIGT